jgi:hypothetical protein
MKAPPPIRVWRETIDDRMVAVIASALFVQGRRLYGLSVFALVEAGTDDWILWRRAGERRLADCLVKDHGGHFPYVGYVPRGTV